MTTLKPPVLGTTIVRTWVDTKINGHEDKRSSEFFQIKVLSSLSNKIA